MRGIFVRKAVRTRAHVFIKMPGYMMAYKLRRLWRDVDVTVQEGIAELASICSIQLRTGGTSCQAIPEPRELGKTGGHGLRHRGSEPRQNFERINGDRIRRTTPHP